MKGHALLITVLGGSDHIRALAAYLQENGPRYPRIGGWLAPRAGLDVLQKETFVPPPHNRMSTSPQSNIPMFVHLRYISESVYLERQKVVPIHAMSE
jgi:hypothetical protein